MYKFYMDVAKGMHRDGGDKPKPQEPVIPVPIDPDVGDGDGDGTDPDPATCNADRPCTSVAPEPSTMLLLASGLIGIAALGIISRRKRLGS